MTRTDEISRFFSNADLRRLIVPLVIEQLLAIAVGLCDSIMVSQVGEAAISAVSLVDTVNVLMVNAFAALATGGAVIAGQYLGRREPEKAGHSATQLILFMLEASLVIMALFYLMKGMILHGLFGAIDADVAAYADTYYMIVETSIPLLAVYNAGAALFRVMGNAGISMKVSLLMNLINVAGNASLIFGLHWGVEGVAVPTVVSRGAAAAAMLVLLGRKDLPMRPERFTLRHDRYVVRNILRFGVTNGLESSMFQMGKIFLLSTVAVFGTASVAANAVGNSIASVQVLGGNAVGLAMVTVISRCIGAGDIRAARYYAAKLLRIGHVCMLVCVAVSLAALPMLMRYYNISEEAEHYARIILWMHGVVSVFTWPECFILPQVLRAAGDTKFTMIVSSVSMWTARIAFGIFLGRYLGLGIVGVWAAMFLDWTIRISFFAVRYFGHRWEMMGLE